MAVSDSHTVRTAAAEVYFRQGRISEAEQEWFGRLRQDNEDLVSFDLTPLSNDAGVEISGILGFAMLRLLDVKIDYRDGLVDFTYDAQRWEH